MSESQTWLQGQMLTFFLEMARCAGLVMVVPFPWTRAPVRVRAALVIFLAVVVHGVAPLAPGVQGELGPSVWALISELVLGLSLGFIVYLVTAVAEVVGDTVAPAMGFGAAQIFDPSTRSQQSVLTSLLWHFALLIALLSGLHRVLIGGVLASFQVVPLGSALQASASAELFIELTSGLLRSALRLSLPLLTILLLTQVMLAFISRAAPAMQIFSVGFAVTLGVGALVLMADLSDFGHGLGAEFSQVGRRLELVLLAVGEAR